VGHGCQTGRVVDLEELKVPKAMRLIVDEIVAVSDAVCLQLLDQEYADLARCAVAKLARKRPSPLRSGTRKVWAAGVVYALGQANFLFDPQTRPYATAEALSEAFAVAKSTMSSKAKLIRDGLKITYFSAEFLRADQIAGNPLIWMITIDGLPCDARSLPVELQAQVYQLGLIPYIPAWGPGRDVRDQKAGQG
jgi:hypothetical protein